MLKTIGGFVLAVILGLCVLQTADGAVLLDRVVAVVNNEVITWSELYKMMEAESGEQIKALSEEKRRKVFHDNEALFLDKLIDMRLQIQEAHRLGLSVSPEDIKDAIENIKKKYSLNDTTLQESLKKEGLSMEEYKERLSDQILISQFVNQKIRSKVVVTDAEVKGYMRRHESNSGDSDSFRFRQIFFKKPKDEAGREAVEEKAASVIRRLKSGEDFSVLAREYSEDPSGRLGGDTGYIKKDQLAAEFVEALSGMKPGDFSSPFWTETGLHIVMLDEKLEKRGADELREEAKKQLADEQFLEEYNSYIKGLREKARIEIRL